MARKIRINFPLQLVSILAACHAQAALTSLVTPSAMLVASPTSTPVMPTPSETPSLFPSPTSTFFQLSAPEEPVMLCYERRPAADHLLAVVTASFSLARDYVPTDLVRLGNYVSGYVTLQDLLLVRWEW